jgi:hypothetical protein
MRSHLFKRQQSCPPLTMDITLTDGIKEYVLQNRVYIPPERRNMTLPTIDTRSLQTTAHTKAYIYLIREREFYHQDKPVYKFGMTKSANVLERLNDYKKGYELIMSQMVPKGRVVEIEKNIKSEFKKIFKQHPDGFEYFIGNPYYMRSVINIVCEDFPPEIANQKLSEIITERNMLADRMRYDDAEYALNKFGEENYDFITKHENPRQYIINILERHEGGICKYIVDKHFNQKDSQNHNIRIDKKFISIYDGEWILRTRDFGIEAIISNVKKDIDRFIQEYGIYDKDVFAEFTRTVGDIIGLKLDDTFDSGLDDKARCKQAQNVYELIHHNLKYSDLM